MSVKNNQKFESKELIELKQLTSHFNNSFANLKARFAIWKSMNDLMLDNEIHLHKTEYVFFTIKNSLLLSCFIDIANLGKDSDSRSLSLVRIKSFLDRKNIQNELRGIRKNTRTPIDFGKNKPQKVVLDNLYEEQTKRRIALFEDSLIKLNEKFNDPSIEVKLKSFWDIRRKSAAHIDLYNEDGELKFFDISKVGLTWDDLDLMIKYFEDINSLLFAVVEATDIGWNPFETDLNKSIEKFWKPFTQIPFAAPAA